MIKTIFILNHFSFWLDFFNFILVRQMGDELKKSSLHPLGQKEKNEDSKSFDNRTLQMKNGLVFFLFLFFFCGFSQQEKDSVSVAVDENQILSTRSFDGDLSKKYTGEEFDYSSQEGGAQNLLKRFLNWFVDWINDSFGIDISPYTLQILEYLIYVLMGALVIYLLVRFLSGENFSAVFTKKATSILDINLSEDHIENVDLDGLIKSALEEKDYRLAVRYQYLRILKMLSQKGIIDWHYEKTNSDYQKEIEAPKVKSGFNEVSYLYDYIWYGEQELDDLRYEVVEARFATLKNSINN